MGEASRLVVVVRGLVRDELRGERCEGCFWAEADVEVDGAEEG
jgi:hypothetical protein